MYGQQQVLYFSASGRTAEPGSIHQEPLLNLFQKS